jgi:hypothetical protein
LGEAGSATVAYRGTAVSANLFILGRSSLRTWAFHNQVICNWIEILAITSIYNMTSFPLDDERDSGDEVEFLGETYNCKELVMVNENEGETEVDRSAKENFVREGHFQLMDLPAELRNYVYSFFLPHNLVISHHKDWRGNPGSNWSIEARTRSGALVPLAMGPQPKRISYNSLEFDDYLALSRANHGVETQLFLVNKFISNEAKGELLAALRTPHRSIG